MDSGSIEVLRQDLGLARNRIAWRSFDTDGCIASPYAAGQLTRVFKAHDLPCGGFLRDPLGTGSHWNTSTSWVHFVIQTEWSGAWKTGAFLIPRVHSPNASDSHFETPNTRMARAAPAVPNDDLSSGPYLFEAPLGNYLKCFCGWSATLAPRIASDHAGKAFELTARSEEWF
ncbi:hypothetical protein EVAR_36638_1 [Eumeta japonica]|uniref:Uncharacterized protein n=1 Tax=Eumeta variegata TaxID=151549 RepID=A0A4C1YNU9_EUMVA|nr:hypothetical protein EVAR_36638_1 [Eumeta japonica]